MTNHLWDRLGLGLSILCAVHCLVAPVILALLPLWPALFPWEAWIHPVLAVLLIPVTLSGMHVAYRRKKTERLILFGFGLILIFLAWLLVAWIGHVGEIVLTLCGSSMLIYAHWKNWRTHD